MTMLNASKETIEKYAPGFEAKLAKLGTVRLESGDEKLGNLFRESGLPGLLVAKTYGGHNASLLEGARVQRILGAHSPSLAVMSTMHSFTAAFCSQCQLFGSEGKKMLEDVAQSGALLASGFAEGRSGAGLFEYQSRATRDGTNFRVNGRKRPCTLASDMDYLTLGFLCHDYPGGPMPGVAMIPASNKGVRTQPFWKAPILSAAGSEEVIVEEAIIPEAMVFVPAPDDEEGQMMMRGTEALAISHFQVLVAASYVGMATNLIERLAARGQTSNADVVDAYTEVEGAMLCLEGAARRIETAPAPSVELLSEAMAARFMAQRAVLRGTDLAVEMLGGRSYMFDPEVAMISTAVHCLGFHPMNRRQSDEVIASAIRPVDAE